MDGAQDAVGIRQSLLGGFAEHVRSSHLVRTAVRALGVTAGVAATVLVGAVAGTVPGGEIALAVGETAAVTVAGAALGGVASRWFPQERGSGRTGLQRLAVGAAVLGVAALITGVVGMVAEPAVAHVVGAIAAAAEAGALGAGAADVAWNRVTDVPVPSVGGPG